MNATEVEHTRTEKNILINNNHPFKFAFQTEKKIYFVLGTSCGPRFSGHKVS
jgi:hypothetical protein